MLQSNVLFCKILAWTSWLLFKLTFCNFILVSSILLCSSSLLLFCSASLICLAAANNNKHCNSHFKLFHFISIPAAILWLRKQFWTNANPGISYKWKRQNQRVCPTYSPCISLVCAALSPGVADAVGCGAAQALVVSSAKRLKVGLHESFPPTNLVNTFHTVNTGIRYWLNNIFSFINIRVIFKHINIRLICQDSHIWLIVTDINSRPVGVMNISLRIIFERSASGLNLKNEDIQMKIIFGDIW